MFFSISRNSLLKMLLLYLCENRLLNRLESLENRPFQTLLCLMGALCGANCGIVKTTACINGTMRLLHVAFKLAYPVGKTYGSRHLTKFFLKLCQGLLLTRLLSLQLG